MKIYINADDEAFTEETIDEEIINLIEDSGYDGVLGYLADACTEQEIFAMLPEDIQLDILDSFKEEIIEDTFWEYEVPDPSCPYANCPYSR